MSALEDRTGFVKAQLAQYGGKKITNTNYTFVLCPYHAEKTPSFQISHNATKPRSSGFGTCRGCGARHKWNDFAPLLGMEAFGRISDEGSFSKMPMDYYDDAIFGKSDKDTNEVKTYSLTDANWTKVFGSTTAKWRTFGRDFLASIKAKLTIRKDGQYYVHLPVLINGVEKGHVHGRLVKEKDLTSFLNKPGPWSKTHGLLMYDQAIALAKKKGYRTLVLVEGPRDALRLLRAGIPAMCILGTQSWSKQKIRLLSDTDFDRIVVCMDGDKPGRDATRLLIKGERIDSKGVTSQVVPSLRESFKVINFGLYNLEPGADPCSMSQSSLRQLKELIW